MVPEKLKHLISNYLPSLTVHIWGGFGSQVFGLLVARRLKENFSNRRIRIAFHTSGVTERQMQIPRYFLQDFVITQVHDYSPNIKGKKSPYQFSNVKVMVKGLVSLLAIRLGFIAQLNNQFEFQLLKPWVLASRGHYTNINLTENELTALGKMFHIDRFVSNSQSSTVLALHFRLGDLLLLDSKSYIDPQRFMPIASQYARTHTIRVYSDSSPGEVRRILCHFNLAELDEVNNLDVEQTIQDCLHSDVFIGTNSKLSLWISVVRLRYGLGTLTYLPSLFQASINNLLRSTDVSQECMYY